MKFKLYASKKVIAIVLATIISFGSIINQRNKINYLEEELYKQQNIVDQRYNYTETNVDVKTIQNNINKICEYKILDSKVNIKHKYVYQRDGILGIDHTVTLVGTADLYYELSVNLKDAVIRKADDRNITIELNYPKVNEKSVHRINNTFVRMDSESSRSLLSNKEDSEKVTRHWEDTFDTKGYQMIKDSYESGYKDTEVRNITINQIQSLFKELGYDQYIHVDIR